MRNKSQAQGQLILEIGDSIRVIKYQWRGKCLRWIKCHEAHRTSLISERKRVIFRSTRSSFLI